MTKQSIPAYNEEHNTLMAEWGNYKGKIVAVIGKKIFSAKNGNEANKLINRLEKKYQKPPLVTYIPKADNLILISKWQ